MASWRGYKEIATILLNSGVNINVKDNFGYTSLMWATQIGNKEIIELLESYSK
jgi:ankyrin repeat protein